MSLRKALLAATMLALPIAAQAQPVTGLYVGAGAGINYRMETEASISGRGAAAARGAGFTRSPDLEFDEIGALGVASVGWGFGNGFRAELEGNYRYNNITGASPRGFSASGYSRTYGVMVNALYDFQIGSPFVPYLGLGVGYAWNELDKVGLRASGGSIRVDDTDGQFAYQAIIGGAFPISGAPGLAVTAEYRFFGTLEPEHGGTLSVGTTRSNVTVGTDNYNHSLLIGLRYNFGAAAAAVAAAPATAAAPAPARTYLVFFDWDRADLTDRARQIIAEAAQNSTRVQATRIEVAGHADRSGTPAYNQRLSQRRADAVAAELVRNGVARNAITVQAFGETRPLVPTADGVREPQNRRVEIVLR